MQRLETEVEHLRKLLAEKGCTDLAALQPPAPRAPEPDPGGWRRREEGGRGEACKGRCRVRETLRSVAAQGARRALGARLPCAL